MFVSAFEQTFSAGACPSDTHFAHWFSESIAEVNKSTVVALHSPSRCVALNRCMAKVVLYSTSCASTLKMKTDISRVKQLLQIKKVDYEEIDLAVEPRRRSEMLLASDGVSSLPQLHLNNKYLGDWDTLQDMEDFGELDTALKVPNSA